MSENITTIGIALQTDGLERGIRSLDELAARGPKVESAAKGISDSSKAAAANVGKLATETEKGGREAAAAARGFGQMSSAVGALKSALAGYLSLQTVGALVRAADAVTLLDNRLRLATGSAAAASAAYSSLYQIAQSSRVSFVELGQTYASIARASGELGLSQQRMLKVTESIANAMTISGGSASSMQAALVQLGQGMASGVLRGEELNSVMEQAPRLAKALADGLNVPIGKLREMGAAGEITSEQVVKALESQSSVLMKEVAGATLTVSQAFTQLSNASINAVGEFDKASGASASLASAIGSIASGMDSLGKSFRENETVIASVMGALAGAAALSSLAAIPRAIGLVTGAVTALGVVMAANPAVLALLGVGAVIGGGVAAINQYKKTADGIKSTIDALEKENERAQKALNWSSTMGASYQGGDDAARKKIEERTEAVKKLRQELAVMSNTGLDTRAEDARFAAQTSEMRAQQRAAEELAGIKQKLSGVDKDYLPTLNKLYKQHQDNNLSLAEYQRLVGQLAKANYKEAKSGNAAANKAKTEAEQLAKAKLGFDIEAIRASSESGLALVSSRESVMEAMRGAGLIAEADYWQQKKAFIVEADRVREESIQREIDRLKKESLSGADKVNNDKKIAEAEAKLAAQRSKSTTELEVNSIRERAALKAIEVQYLQAQAAAQSYVDTIRRQNDREIGAIGMGDLAREKVGRQNQREDQFQGRKDQLDGQLRANQITRSQYDQYVEIEREALTKSLALDADYWAQKMARQAEWSVGASEALNNYLDQSRNVAGQTADMWTRGFTGMEDAIVNFVMTGKASFSDLAKSVIADMIRIQARAAMSSALSSLFGAWTGAAGGVGNAGYGDYSSAGLSAAYGYSGGGWTGPGGKYDFAGFVHADEGVLTKEEIAALGGPTGFESLRKAIRGGGHASGGIVGAAGYSRLPQGGASHDRFIVNNYGSPKDVEAKQQRNSNGGMDFILTIKKAIKDEIAGEVATDSGVMGQAMRTRAKMGM
jgi:lambda family phage tail tape measure protein